MTVLCGRNEQRPMPKRSSSIFLASRSPRRRQLLTQIGIDYELVEVDVPEARTDSETPSEYVIRVASEKAHAGWQRVKPRATAPVVGADTVVVLGDDVLGKPDDVTHAKSMLARLSGQMHSVYTAVTLVHAGATSVRLSRNRVWFKNLSDREIEAYCASGEPLDKAGAYAIQGLAAAFVMRIDGSYSGIMGLPLFETVELLTAADVDPFARAS